MDQTDQMKVLLEAVDAPKVDAPDNAYANAPNEQTLDSATQQNFGSDLNKKKSRQFKYKPGDNSRAARMQEYKLQEDRLTKEFEKFKLVETKTIENWETRRELSDLLDKVIKSTNAIDSLVSPTEFNDALLYLWQGDVASACDVLMQNYTDHNGGEMRNHAAVDGDLQDELNHILSNKVEETLEAVVEPTSNLNHSLSR